MARIPLPAPEEAWKGVGPAFKNAESLLQSAKLLADAGKHGHALSVLVLASEEVAKSVLLTIQAIGFMPLLSFIEEKLLHIADADGIELPPGVQYELALGDHVQKHGLAIQVLIFTVSREKLGALPDEAPMSEYFKVILTPDGDELKELLLGFAWFAKANSFKNQGLYVDPGDGWLGPEQVTEDDYLEGYGLVEKIIGGLRHNFGHVELTPAEWKSMSEELSQRQDEIKITLQKEIDEDAGQLAAFIREATTVWGSTGDEPR